ncbi:MAG: DUF6457 domain-containing protein [Candidatus Dormibacteria bacterium]
MQDGVSGADDPNTFEEQWCRRFAAELAAAAGLDEELMSSSTRTSLLQLARDVAHGSERRNAPLATFVAGRYVEARRRQGIGAALALEEVSGVAARLLPDGDATPQRPGAG